MKEGQIILSPAKVYHSLYQAEISYQLRSMLNWGKTLTECAIKTRQGTKVADVAWTSLERLEKIKGEVECSIAPEICVEILSSSNTDDEIRNKREIYFETGSQEVWICTAEGNISFYNPQGQLEHSILVPQFPTQISI